MNNSQIFNFIKFTAKLILAILTGLFLLIYIIVLIDKINRPNFKNLTINEFVIIGVILLILIFINLRWFFKKNKI